MFGELKDKPQFPGDQPITVTVLKVDSPRLAVKHNIVGCKGTSITVDAEIVNGAFQLRATCEDCGKCDIVDAERTHTTDESKPAAKPKVIGKGKPRTFN